MIESAYNNYMIKNGYYQELEDCNFIGKGMNGTAYQLSDEVILKITKDFKEAETAMLLIGSNFNNTVKIHDVEYDSNEERFIIIQEKLDTSCQDEISLYINYFLEELDIDMVDDKDYLEDFFKNKDGLDYDDFLLNKKEIIKFISDINNHKSELEYSGIITGDIHEGNIGKNNNGDYVVFDVSHFIEGVKKHDEYELNKVLDFIQNKKEKYLKEIFRGLGTHINTINFYYYDLENHTLKGEDSTIEIYKSPLPIISLNDKDIYSPKIIEIKKRNEYYIVETESVDYSINEYAQEIIFALRYEEDVNEENINKLKSNKIYGQHFESILKVINSFNEEGENKLEYCNLSDSEYDREETLCVLKEATFGINIDGEIRIKNVVLDDYLKHNNVYYINDNIEEICEKYSGNKKEGLKNRFG